MMLSHITLQEIIGILEPYMSTPDIRKERIERVLTEQVARKLISSYDGEPREAVERVILWLVVYSKTSAEGINAVLQLIHDIKAQAKEDDQKHIAALQEKILNEQSNTNQIKSNNETNINTDDVRGALNQVGGVLTVNRDLIIHQSISNSYEAKDDGKQTSQHSDLKLTAKQHFELGNEMYGKGDYRKAIASYEEAIKLDPRSFVVYNSLGIARQAVGEIDEAIAAFTKAMRINSQYADAYNNRGNIYLAKDELEFAVKDFSTAIRLNQMLYQAFINRGWAYYKMGKYEEAIEDYVKAIDINPDIAIVYNNLGIARQAKDDIDGAIVEYDKAIKLDPKYIHTYYSRGIARELNNDLRGAIADWEEYIKLGGPRKKVVGIWLANARKRLK
jgi:tetratricopeptide (TPR) repeat protein